MQVTIPGPFTYVSLGDRATWHRATLREWLDHRSFLVEKLSKQGDAGDWEKKKVEALMEVSRRLAEETGFKSGRRRPPRGGNVSKRKAELMDELFYKKYPQYDPMTAWELEYLDVTSWLDGVMAKYESTQRRSDIGMLFTWLIAVEDEEGLAVRRSEQRVRNQDAVGHSSRRLKSNKNPYYPRPAELIWIALAVETIVWNIKRDFETFIAFGDPVPDTESEEDFRIRDFMTSGRCFDSAGRFVDTLRRLGYMPYQNEFDCRNWEGWQNALKSGTRAASRELLAYIFNTKVDTIRRNISSGTLESEYRRVGLARKHWRFVERRQSPDAVTVFRSGWTSRIHEGNPSRYDIGPTYGCMPYYPM